MARRQVSFELGGEQYRVLQLGAVDGRRYVLRILKGLAPLLKNLGPILGPILDQAATGGSGRALVSQLLETEASTFKGVLPPTLEALAQLLSELDERLFDELCLRFAQVTEVRIAGTKEFWPYLAKDDNQAVFADHFAGRYALMFRWFGKCVAINGGVFLGDWASTSHPPSEAEA
jgi:hypothetical protein